MILTIDIGNSTIGFSFLSYHQEVSQQNSFDIFKIENLQGSELVSAKLDYFLSSHYEKYDIKEVVICSVVPNTLKFLKKKIKKILKIRPKVIGSDLKIPMNNCYKSPRQVGKDRLLCAFAARELYGAPCVVIDLGTAITFDGISKQGDYLGGAIVPGLRLSAEALFEKTALLPRTNIAEPKKVIGRSTKESIQSGLFYGFGALCDGMVGRLQEEMKCPLKVVLTGGYAEMMKRFMKHPSVIVEPALVFKGMALVLKSS